MPRDILIRNVTDETYRALGELKPPELSQTEFLGGLDDAVLDSKQLSILQNRTTPEQIETKTHFKFVDLFRNRRFSLCNDSCRR